MKSAKLLSIIGNRKSQMWKKKVQGKQLTRRGADAKKIKSSNRYISLTKDKATFGGLKAKTKPKMVIADQSGIRKGTRSTSGPENGFNLVDEYKIKNLKKNSFQVNNQVEEKVRRQVGSSSFNLSLKKIEISPRKHDM